MPLNVRKCCAFSFLVVLLLWSGLESPVSAQTVPSPIPAGTTNPDTTAAQPPVVTPPPAPTSGDVMHARISKAKAYIVVRNYNAAIYELENIRKETSDTAVRGVVNVLLMNSYLEQGDYKRAQDLLSEFYTAQKTNKPNAPASYTAVAAQIIKGA